MLRNAILGILTTLVLLGLGAWGYMTLFSPMQSAKAADELSAVESNIAADQTLGSLQVNITNDDFSGDILLPSMRPFTSVTSFEYKNPADLSTVLFTGTFKSGSKLSIAKSASVTGSFVATGNSSKEVKDTGGTAVVEYSNISKSIGIPAIFTRTDESTLEKELVGLLRCNETAFYKTYKTSPSSISTNTSKIWYNLATALFETYEFNSTGTLQATPLANNYALTSGNSAFTIMFTTMPDKTGLKRVGVSGKVIKDSDTHLRYIAEVGTDYNLIEKIIVAKVFDGNSTGKEELISSLIESILACQPKAFIVYDKTIPVNNQTNLPAVTLGN